MLEDEETECGHQLSGEYIAGSKSELKIELNIAHEESGKQNEQIGDKRDEIKQPARHARIHRSSLGDFAPVSGS